MTPPPARYAPGYTPRLLWSFVVCLTRDLRVQYIILQFKLEKLKLRIVNNFVFLVSIYSGILIFSLKNHYSCSRRCPNTRRTRCLPAARVLHRSDAATSGAAVGASATCGCRFWCKCRCMFSFERVCHHQQSVGDHYASASAAILGDHQYPE